MNRHVPPQTALRLILILFALWVTGGVTYGQSGAGEPGVLRNPLNQYGGADPRLTYYEGSYYLATTTWSSELTMRKSETLAGLKTAEPVRIYFETDPARCCNMWAPEFHLLNGPNGLRWYFYYTAGTAGTYDNQRSYVLESAGADPMGPYTFKGRVYDPQNDYWSIDGSILQLNDSLYFLFSAFIGSRQSIFIAPMRNPWTISGGRTLLSQPEYDWELSGSPVNEGPVALQHDGDTFIVYSASGCWTPDYKLGMLTYIGGDPLSMDSWVKNAEPVFQRSDENGVYAPGHNGFFRSPDGSEDWIVYHANDAVTDGCDGGRMTRVQKIIWNADGTPDFGIPIALDEPIASPSGDRGTDPLSEFQPRMISRFKSLGMGAYIRHTNFQIRYDLSVAPLADSQFVVVPGLADAEAVSIQASNFPGFYLRQQNNVISLSADDNTESFAADATWWIRPGLADESLISLESYSQPGYYLGRKFSIAALVELIDATTAQEREDATFIEEN